MEAHKRKQADADVVSRRQKLKKKARADKRDETAVTDDHEVEEFFAILRRIHVAVTYFKNANGGGTKYMDVGGLRAVLESNEEEDGDTKKKEDEDVDVVVGWDLNADPEPECDLS